MRRLRGAREAAGRPGRQEASTLGRTADWLAGALQGGWDKVTRTTYVHQSEPRTPTPREAQASARLLRGRPGRNAWERAMHADAVLGSDDDGKTWYDVRWEFDEFRWPPIERPGYQEPEEEDPDCGPGPCYPVPAQYSRDFCTEITRAGQAEFEGELEAGA